MQKKGLVFGLIIFLCIPTTVFGKEPATKSNSTEQFVNPFERTNTVSITNSPNLVSLPTITPKEQSVQNAGKGPVVETNKHQVRFIQNAIQFVNDMKAGNYRQAVKSSSRALKKSISEQWLEIYWTSLMQQLQSQAGS